MSRWIPRRVQAEKRANVLGTLFCFPPAGAGAGYYRNFGSQLYDFDVRAVQLPGREERFLESAWTDARAISEVVAEDICRESFETIVLMGYSYGALLAYETALALETRGTQVVKVISCARGAPQARVIGSTLGLDDTNFYNYVRDLGGLPPEFDQMEELRDLIMPSLRADFAANERYVRRGPERLCCAIDTIIGSNDPETSGERETAWAECTSGPYRSFVIDGGHFFISENPDAFTAVLRKCLADAVADLTVADAS